tara:strand:- start:745 stop:942 length:198 start_codon:yes stop_codon:yes gene_type:complete
MALEKIVGWELIGYTNDGQVVDLSECPNDVANAVDSWIEELESDPDVTRDDYIYRDYNKKETRNG